MTPSPTPSPARAQVLETHISTIVLVGDRAYELRKPVRSGFRSQTIDEAGTPAAVARVWRPSVSRRLGWPAPECASPCERGDHRRSLVASNGGPTALVSGPDPRHADGEAGNGRATTPGGPTVFRGRRVTRPAVRPRIREDAAEVGSTLEEARSMDEPRTFDHSPEVLDNDACFFLLQSRDLGRIAFTFKGLPEIFPVNYATAGGLVVFRTGPGTKLDVVPRTPVALEVDSWEPELGTGWSVVIKGRAEEITANPGRTAEHLRRARVHPVAPGDRWHWLAIRPSEVTGRHFHVRPHPDQARA